MTHILLVEDDSGIVDSLSLYLAKSDIKMSTAHNGEEAVNIFKDSETTFDLIILDLNLPKKDGFSVCKEIRETSIVPIIILSARDNEDDKVRALELGADDYISKPFSPRELVARIGAILKRLGKPATSSSQKEGIVSFESIKLDLGEYILKISDEIIKVTKTEFLILAYLIEHKDHIVARETLMKEIIGYDHYIYDRTIDTHMKNLRKKIGDAATIETVRGIGYRIIKTSL
ncbi:MAG: response regulator transcription factor [Candidatus Gracilibacteria bacterium]|nr:response regulator transcription factor [Candidatus Gracilibacteria bacterium]